MPVRAQHASLAPNNASMRTWRAHQLVAVLAIAHTVRVVALALEPFVLFEGPIDGLRVDAFGTSIDVTHTLSNGRSSYVLFQFLVAFCLGLDGNSEGGDSDLSSGDTKIEVKAYADPALRPSANLDWFHTAASSTFGPNNRGPELKRLLEAKKYQDALAVCTETGYAKNDFYVYTNTSGYQPTVPLRFIVIPTDTVLSLLSPIDPRLINRRDVLATATRTERITPAALGL